MSLLQSCKKQEVNSTDHLQTINGVLGVNTVNDPFFISSEFAKRVAERLPADYMTSEHNGYYTEVVRNVDSIIPLRFEDDVLPAAYIVNYTNNDGYVIISADARYEPLPASISEGNLHTNDSLQGGMLEWLGFQLETLKFIRSGTFMENEVMDLAHSKWQSIYIDWDINAGLSADDKDFIRPVGRPDEGTGPRYIPCSKEVKNKLLSTAWAQGNGYNDLLNNMNCSDYINGRPPVGCVATATAQILKYWSKPNTNYNYSLMPTGDNSSYEVQRLMRDLGQPSHLNMIYDCKGSGAASVNVISTLANHFAYSNSGQLINYTSTSIFNVSNSGFNLVKADLDQNEVVYFEGTEAITYKRVWPLKTKTVPGNSAHAWLCDGYTIIDANCSPTKYLHMNWGWGNRKSQNGLYLENDWSPRDYSYKFNYDRKAIININPN